MTVPFTNVNGSATAIASTPLNRCHLFCQSLDGVDQNVGQRQGVQHFVITIGVIGSWNFGVAFLKAPHMDQLWQHHLYLVRHQSIEGVVGGDPTARTIFQRQQLLRMLEAARLQFEDLSESTLIVLDVTLEALIAGWCKAACYC